VTGAVHLQVVPMLSMSGAASPPPPHLSSGGGAYIKAQDPKFTFTLLHILRPSSSVLFQHLIKSTSVKSFSF
jgi:hypothetical protein